MEKQLRLYRSFNSSYFNLIEGDKETQQTKGLGLLLSKSDLALKTFLAIQSLVSKVGKIDLNKMDRLIINCELTSKKDRELRADIVLRFYVDKKPFKAIIIEAKSVNKNTSVLKASEQLEEYINNKWFEELEEFGSECYGVTLTKYASTLKHPHLVSITWSEVIEAFYKNQSGAPKDDLLPDYTNFIMSINGSMKFYEREVYSIPTSSWSKKAIDDYGIYECPTVGPYVIRYTPLYLAFRAGDGGVMEKLYKVDQVIILNFQNNLDAFLKADSYDQSIKDSVRGYADYLLGTNIWNSLPPDDKQVFILSKQSIELRNRPRPKRNNSFRAYYTLADILNNEIVGMPQEGEKE